MATASGQTVRGTEAGSLTMSPGSQPQNIGWQSDHPPGWFGYPWNRSWWSIRHPKQFDRQALHNTFVACFTDFGRAPRSTHDSAHVTCGPNFHDSSCATRGTGVPTLPAALLTLPSGYAEATNTASVSAVATGEGCTGGTLAQPSSNDHVDKAGLPATGQQTHHVGHFGIDLVTGALLHPRRPR
jgi:hypothetical protein